MTHVSEYDFSDVVQAWLEETFGQSTVDDYHHLSESDRIADFYVNLGRVGVVVEVENDFEAVVRGVGQSLLYGAHFPNAWPLVVVPEGHIENPEFEYFRHRSPVAIVELPTDYVDQGGLETES